MLYIACLPERSLLPTIFRLLKKSRRKDWDQQGKRLSASNSLLRRKKRNGNVKILRDGCGSVRKQSNVLGLRNNKPTWRSSVRG